MSAKRGRPSASLAPGATAWDVPPLKLRAQDAEDLAVMSAQLQDAVVPVVDLAFLPEDELFVMIVNRFRWDIGRLNPDLDPFDTDTGPEDQDGPEDGDDPDGGSASAGYYLRTNCAVRFANTKRVVSQKIDLKARGVFLNLLAVHAAGPEPSGEGEVIELVFAGDATLRLTVGALDCALEDLGEPWPTTRRPSHPIEEIGNGD